MLGVSGLQGQGLALGFLHFGRLAAQRLSYSVAAGPSPFHSGSKLTPPFSLMVTPLVELSPLKAFHFEASGPPSICKAPACEISLRYPS